MYFDLKRYEILNQIPGQFFLFLPISVDKKNVGPAEIPWGTIVTRME